MPPPVDVYIAGRALASALGPDLRQALQSLPVTAPCATTLSLAPQVSVPYLAIPDAAHDWLEHARHTLRQVVADCGSAPDPHTPLFIASSSLNIGAWENGTPYRADCQSFVEQMAAWIDWRGPVYWLSTACTSALNALLAARRLIRAGAADEALVLGVELRNRFSAAGFAGMQLLDPHSARPLAADRGGLVLGEAVAALHLTRRPARWRLRGGANLIDGRDPAGASVEAVARMTATALADAGLATNEIDLIKLQAAGSPHNDAVEIAGLRQTFAVLPPLVTVKPVLGHTLGAAGAAEVALLTACLEHGVWPPPLDCPPDHELAASLAAQAPGGCRHLLATILGFGGGHTAVVLEDTTGGRA